MFARRLFDQFLACEGCASRFAQVIILCVVFTSVALFPDPSSAQSASFRSVDTNSDRALTLDELVAAFGRNGANRLMRSTDHNGDGRITIPELRRGPDDEDRDDNRRPGSSRQADDDRGEDGGDGNEGDDDRGDHGDDDGGGDDSGDDGGDDDGGDDD